MVIFDYGFDKGLKRSLTTKESSVVYDSINQAVQSQQIDYSGIIGSQYESNKFGLARVVPLIKAENMISGSANAVVTFTIPAANFLGCTISWACTAKNSTAVQNRTGFTSISCVTNGVGTLVSATSEIGSAVAVSAGTLTGTWSVAQDGDKITLKFTPTSSLTAPTISLYSNINALVKTDLPSTLNTACFLAGTMIDTPTGKVLIENIKYGDSVLSLDGMIIKVLKTTSHFVDSYYELRTEYGTTGVTGDHPYMLQDGTFKPVKELKVGDILKSSELVGVTKLLGIEKCPVPATIYNLTVEVPHVFVADNVYVHNKGSPA